MKCSKTLHLTSKTNRSGQIKRKIFSALAVVLFMSSSVNVFAFELTKCEKLAVETHTLMQENGVDHATAYALSEAIQKACEKANK